MMDFDEWMKNDPMPRVKKAIQMMKQGREDGQTELRKALYTCFDGGKWVHMITPGKTEDGMDLLDIREEQGKGVIAWYTGAEEIKHTHVDLLITDINKLIEPMYSNPDIMGMIINPDTDGLVITKDYLLGILLFSKYPNQHLDPDPPRDWGPGIPEYSPSDLMTKAEFINFAMETVFTQIRDEYNIISMTDNPDAVVNIVAEKDDELCLIAVRGECSEVCEPPTVEEIDTMLEYKDKYHVKCFLAFVNYRSADPERFEKFLALRGDGFYAKYTGLVEI